MNLRLASLALLVPATTAFTFSQQLLKSKFGEDASSALLPTVAVIGDLDSDGRDDLLVSTLNGVQEVRVLSSATLNPIHQIQAGGPEEFFGYQIKSLGDVNADGHDDFAVSAPVRPGLLITAAQQGKVRVYSGLDGQLLYTVPAPAPRSNFGESMCRLNDINGDGVGDFAVSAWPAFFTQQGPSRVYLLSGADGSVLMDIPVDGLGRRIAAAGDLDGDGRDDLLLTSISSDSLPELTAISSITGSSLYGFRGDYGRSFVGDVVASVGDLDQDGIDDFVLGEPTLPSQGVPIVGAFRAVSGVDGSPLYLREGLAGSLMNGVSIEPMGDMTGDGVPDYLVGAWRQTTLVSGADGSQIYKTPLLPLGTIFGEYVAGGADWDGDRVNDFVVGATSLNLENPFGSAHLFSGQPLIGAGASACSPVPNSAGRVGRIWAGGSDLVSDNRVVLSAVHLPANQIGFFLSSQTVGFRPGAGGSQGNFCLGGSIGRHLQSVQTTGEAGSLALDMDLTSIPAGTGTQAVLAGQTWYFQAWHQDSGATSNFTDSLAVSFQ